MRRTTTLGYRVLVADLLWICIALLVALWARYGPTWGGQTLGSISWSFGPELGPALLVWILLSSWKRLDGFTAGWWLPAVVSQVSVATGTLMLLLLAGEYLAHNYVSRLVLIYFGGL